MPAAARVHNDFSGKTVIVTGGASGIGRACVETFLGEGATVWTWDLRPDTAMLGALHPYECDITDASSVDAAMTAVVEADGPPEVMVCNAGIGWTKTVTETEADEWRLVIDTNLTGAFLTARSAAKQMRSAHGGSIILVSSTHALRTIPETGPYAASKAGILGLMRALALEAAPWGVRVNAVLPGAVDTPALRAEAELSGLGVDEMVRRWGAARPMNRIATTMEIAAVVRFLASSAASYMTGIELIADGGLMAAMPAELATFPDPDDDPQIRR